MTALLEVHLSDLRKSGLTEETSKAASIHSLSDAELIKKANEALGFCPEDLETGYLIPYGLNGSQKTWRVRLHPPIKGKDGKDTRYLSPKGSEQFLYFPPGVSTRTINPVASAIYIIEGEKKTLKVWQSGFPCTVGISGCWNWTKDGALIKDFEAFAWDSRLAVIVPDSDCWDPEKTEIKRAFYALGKELEKKGAFVRFAVLPHGENSGKTGVDDFLLTRSVEDFKNLKKIELQDEVFEGCESWFKKWKNKKETQIETRDLPEIDAGEKQLPVITQNCWKAIISANEKSPTILRFGNSLARIEIDDRNNPIVRILNKHMIRFELAKRARFYAEIKRGQNSFKVAALPPMVAIEDGILATPEKPVPVLRSIVTTPVFAPNGALVTNPGYCHTCQCFYIPLSDLKIPEVKNNPSAEDVAEAKRLILGELLVDFPFQSDTDTAHAVAMFILPAVRNMVSGSTPLYGIDAPTQGTGKSLLVSATMGVWVENAISVMTEAREEDDWRKKIFSTLRGAPSVIRIDNLKRKLESAALEAALTAPYFEDRVLGSSENAAVPVQAVWTCTGNNILLGSEMARRFVRIRLNPQSDAPWLRNNFKHKNLLGWVSENRGKLIWAGLTIAQSWIAAGRPSYSGQILGSYEHWSNIVGGILQHCGIEGFLQNLAAFYKEADQEADTYLRFVHAWNEKWNSVPVGSSDLFELAVESGIELGKGGDRSARTRLGLILSKMRDRVFDGLIIEKGGVVNGNQKWLLVQKLPF